MEIGKRKKPHLFFVDEVFHSDSEDVGDLSEYMVVVHTHTAPFLNSTEGVLQPVGKILLGHAGFLRQLFNQAAIIGND